MKFRRRMDSQRPLQSAQTLCKTLACPDTLHYIRTKVDFHIIFCKLGEGTNTVGRCTL